MDGVTLPIGAPLCARLRRRAARLGTSPSRTASGLQPRSKAAGCEPRSSSSAAVRQLRVLVPRAKARGHSEQSRRSRVSTGRVRFSRLGHALQDGRRATRKEHRAEGGRREGKHRGRTPARHRNEASSSARLSRELRAGRGEPHPASPPDLVLADRVATLRKAISAAAEQLAARKRDASGPDAEAGGLGPEDISEVTQPGACGSGAGPATQTTHPGSTLAGVMAPKLRTVAKALPQQLPMSPVVPGPQPTQSAVAPGPGQPPQVPPKTPGSTTILAPPYVQQMPMYVKSKSTAVQTPLGPPSSGLEPDSEGFRVPMVLGAVAKSRVVMSMSPSAVGTVQEPCKAPGLGISGAAALTVPCPAPPPARPASPTLVNGSAAVAAAAASGPVAMGLSIPSSAPGALLAPLHSLLPPARPASPAVVSATAAAAAAASGAVAPVSAATVPTTSLGLSSPSSAPGVAGTVGLGAPPVRGSVARVITSFKAGHTNEDKRRFLQEALHSIEVEAQARAKEQPKGQGKGKWEALLELAQGQGQWGQARVQPQASQAPQVQPQAQPQVAQVQPQLQPQVPQMLTQALRFGLEEGRRQRGRAGEGQRAREGQEEEEEKERERARATQRMADEVKSPSGEPGVMSRNHAAAQPCNEPQANAMTSSDKTEAMSSPQPTSQPQPHNESHGEGRTTQSMANEMMNDTSGKTSVMSGPLSASTQPHSEWRGEGRGAKKEEAEEQQKVKDEGEEQGQGQGQGQGLEAGAGSRAAATQEEPALEKGQDSELGHEPQQPDAEEAWVSAQEDQYQLLEDVEAEDLGELARSHGPDAVEEDEEDPQQGEELAGEGEEAAETTTVASLAQALASASALEPGGVPVERDDHCAGATMGMVQAPTGLIEALLGHETPQENAALVPVNASGRSEEAAPGTPSSPSSPREDGSKAAQQGPAAAPAAQAREVARNKRGREEQSGMPVTAPAPVPPVPEKVQTQAKPPAYTFPTPAGAVAASKPKAVLPSRSRSTQALESNRLGLVLDVDQTLVHTIPQSSFSSRLDVSRFVNEQGEPELFEWSGRDADPMMACYTKLRPGVRGFLQELKHCYDLSIFSMGDRDYLDFVLSKIDPDGTIFVTGSVASRSDTIGDSQSKHISRVCRHADQRTVIFDDCYDVWKQDIERSRSQLAFVRAYPYRFLDTHRTELSEALGDPGEERVPEDPDVHLAHATRLFKALHSEVAGPAHPSTKSALREVWLRTLRGLRLCLADGRVEGGIWKAAQAFGAQPEQQLSEDVHMAVLQEPRRSSCTVQARKLGIPCVHATWLSFCFATFTLQDPRPFYVGEDCEEFWCAPGRWQQKCGGALRTEMEVRRHLEEELLERRAKTKAKTSNEPETPQLSHHVEHLIKAVQATRVVEPVRPPRPAQTVQAQTAAQITGSQGPVRPPQQPASAVGPIQPRLAPAAVDPQRPSASPEQLPDAATGSEGAAASARASEPPAASGPADQDTAAPASNRPKRQPSAEPERPEQAAPKSSFAASWGRLKRLRRDGIGIIDLG